MKPLDGQTAIVTGASRGIGRAVALRLASLGASVGVNYYENREAARSTVEEICEQGGVAAELPFDVSDPARIKKAISGFVAEQGRLDILVNNAGIVHNALLLRSRPDDVDRVLAVNLGGVIHCSGVAAGFMVKARTGRIVNVTSVVAETGNAGQSVYAASKAGIVGFTKSAARELASRNITVNAVSPGFIDTEMTSGLPEQRQTDILGTIPLGRIGAPAEVAGAVAFLSLPESGYITGHVLHVNGGMHM